MPAVNHKRVYRVMKTNGLLLQRRAPVARPQRRHDGRVSVDASNQRWCSDGFEFRCDDGQAVRTTFALDCCDRAALSWVASTEGYTGDAGSASPWPARTGLSRGRAKNLRVGAMRPSTRSR